MKNQVSCQAVFFLALLSACLFLYRFAIVSIHLVSGKQQIDFIMAVCKELRVYLNTLWMNHTQASTPLLAAANSLFLPSCGHRTTWTAQLCWDGAQHKQPRPVCFIHHPHHFLLESICGRSRIREIMGFKKKGWKLLNDLEDADYKLWHNCRPKWAKKKKKSELIIFWWMCKSDAIPVLFHQHISQQWKQLV